MDASPNPHDDAPAVIVNQGVAHTAALVQQVPHVDHQVGPEARKGTP